MNDWLTLLLAMAWLIPLLPLLAGLLIALRGVLGPAAGEAAEPTTARVAEAAAVAGLLLLLALDLAAWGHGLPGQPPTLTWFAGSRWRAELSLLLDPLSLAVATVSALIGWLVTRFSRNYLHREPGFQRFFMLLMLFLGGVQLLFLAGNSLLLFVGWEWCGLASFLLIGFQRQRPLATGNALFALTSNRVGDAGLLFALGLSAFWLGDFSWARLQDPALSVLELRLLALGFVVAALVKSAQFPFSPWIIRALEGPTPSSAIFYGAVLVHAGVYLLLRLEPALSRVPDMTYGLVAVGGLTAVYAWFCAQVQSDVKSGLIFGTLFQVALMVIAIGCGWCRPGAPVPACRLAHLAISRCALLAAIDQAASAAATGLAGSPPGLVHRCPAAFLVGQAGANPDRPADRGLRAGSAAIRAGFRGSGAGRARAWGSGRPAAAPGPGRWLARPVAGRPGRAP